MKLRHCLIALVLIALAAPVSAQELGLRGLGPRVGVTSGPDQVFAGMQFDFGDFAPNLRFQPNFEIAAGDDFTILSVTAPVHYRFKVSGNITPYAGGGVTLARVNHDFSNKPDEHDFEIALKGVGGVEWPLSGNNAFFLEANVGFGDIQDVAVLAGWMFGVGGGRTSGPSKSPNPSNNQQP